jgi:putative phosphoesterase
MRILLIADVHANWEALLALQRAEPQPDAVLFAGDAAGYGPEPAICAQWLLANTALAVRGNHDEALSVGGAAGAPPELAEAARETLAHARRVIGPRERDRLGRWPLQGFVTLGGARFSVVHGTPADPLAGRVDATTHPEAKLHSLFDDVAADVIVLGHTHAPALRKLGGRVIVNPGSVGQPRYGAPDATYAVWEDGQIQIKHLHYDHEAAARRLRLLPLSPEVARQLIQTLECGMA